MVDIKNKLTLNFIEILFVKFFILMYFKKKLNFIYSDHIVMVYDYSNYLLDRKRGLVYKQIFEKINISFVILL